MGFFIDDVPHKFKSTIALDQNHSFSTSYGLTDYVWLSKTKMEIFLSKL